MNKKERLEKIRRFVNDFEIGTQEEIVTYLRQSGIKATQATVSRDIKELGIVKTPLKNNTYIYEIPKSMSSSLKLAENTILEASSLGNMINLNLVPGSTSVIKRQITEAFSEKIFSIITDDDSILMILKDKEDISRILDVIENW